MRDSAVSWSSCRIPLLVLDANRASEIGDHWPVITKPHRAVARASSLSPDDLEYVLNAFPLFSHKHPDFFAYLRQCLEELSQPEGVDGPCEPMGGTMRLRMRTLSANYLS